MTQPTHSEVVTPSNSVDLQFDCTAIYVGTGGDVAAVNANGSAVTVYKNVPSGSYLWGEFSRVNATDTNAADMVASRGVAPVAHPTLTAADLSALGVYPGLGLIKAPDVALNVTNIAGFPFNRTLIRALTGVNQGTKTFSWAGAISGIDNAITATVFGSTGKDGTYTIVSHTTTSITVSQSIGSAVVDGSLQLRALDANIGITLLSPAAGTDVAYPVFIQVLTSTGSVWAVAINADVSLASQIHDGSMFAVNDNLTGARDSAALAPGPTLQNFMTFALTSPAYVNLGGMIGQAWKVWSTADPTNGGATYGTRTLLYRVFYVVLPTTW